MRHSVMLVAALCVAVGTAQVSAQQSNVPQQQTAADLASAYQAWQQARDGRRRSGSANVSWPSSRRSRHGLFPSRVNV